MKIISRTSKPSPIMMDCVKSVYLLAATVVEISLDEEDDGAIFGWVHMGFEHEKMAPYSKKVKTLFDFFHEKEENDYDFGFLHIRWDRKLKQFFFTFEEEMMDLLSSVLPDPFLQILIEDPSDKENPVLLDERLQIKDIMQHIEMIREVRNGDNGTEIMGNWIQFNDGLPLKTDDEMVESPTISILVGWTEESVIKQCGNMLMERLFKDDSTKELTLVAGNGAELKCHRNILAGNSAKLLALPGMKTGKNRIEMRESSAEGLGYLLKYLYAVDLITDDLSSDVAVELFKTARKYELHRLDSSLDKLFRKKDVKWFTPNILLKLYFYVENEKKAGLGKLRDHLLFLMAGMKSQELRSSDAYLKLDPMDQAALAFKLVDYMRDRYRSNVQN